MDKLIEAIQTHNLSGLVIGALTFLVIGLFHPLVIKAEYHFGTRSWWFFLILGLAAAAGSVLLRGMLPSVLAGVVAFSSFWSILEVFEQAVRVRKGWFPANPKRSKGPGNRNPST